jgi:hypothetical protein
VVEVDVPVPPVRERVTGATVLRGAIFRDSARGEPALTRRSIVPAVLPEEESVATLAVPALRATIPTTSAAAASLGLIDFLPVQGDWVGSARLSSFEYLATVEIPSFEVLFYCLAGHPVRIAYTTMLSS